MIYKTSDFGKHITHECKAELAPYLDANPQRSSGLSFVSLCMWGQQYYRVIDGFLCIIGRDSINFNFPGVYLCPPFSADGQYDPKKLKEVILKVKQEVCPQGEPLLLLGVSDVDLPLYNEVFEGLAEPIENDEVWDYIYLRSDLEYLKGRKYTVKRNHINHLKARRNYVYEAITPACIDELEQALDDFLERKMQQDQSESFVGEEVEVVRRMLPIYEELGMFGGFIRIDGKIKAFAMGSMINPEMVDIAVEKADNSIRGLYQAINKEFVKALPPEVLYINREEDMGVKGLREAKSLTIPAV